MKCRQCHHDNPQHALFCMKCGSALQRKCKSCGTVLPEKALYCMECGEKLESRDPTEDGRQHAREAKPERRQLTVMFCDLVDSSALSEKLDPEDLRDVLRRYQDTCHKIIRRFDGYIAQYLGDGLLVYFGYPQAHEDDALRAALTGLGIIEAISHINPHLQKKLAVRLAARIGIHTGLVVTGEVGQGLSREHLAVGDTPNIAARLQGKAAPNAVVVSAATYKLIEGYFTCRTSETILLKGFSEAIAICQIEHVSTARLRQDPVSRKLTPIVGREQESNLLFERWQRIHESMGQVVLISGDAGIGKSRLVKALEEHVAIDPQAWLTPCQCSPYHQNSALYPVIELLNGVVLQLAKDLDPHDKLIRLEGFFTQYGLVLSEVVPVFGNLLSLPYESKYPPSTLPPERQKQLIFETMLGILWEIANQQPLLLVMEDLHWADPTTLEFLDLLVNQIATSRIFLLFTYRPNFNPPWPPRSFITSLMLHRLTRDKSLELVRHLPGGKILPDHILEEILKKTDGVPLFLEELTKMVIESELLKEDARGYTNSSGRLPLTIPMTLQDSLMARLDRLGSAKELVQLCAIIGREFTSEMLLRVRPDDKEMIQQGLQKLVESELLYKRGVFPKATYVFKHALIQETAYRSMLKSTRRQYHLQIADMLVEHFPDQILSQPELIAYHYTQAENGKAAILYWQRAAQRAVERFANEEAIVHLTKARAILKNLPETSKRREKELELLLAIGPLFISIKGHAAREVELTYSRARTLCREIGQKAQLFQVLWGLWGFYVVRANHREAREVGAELLKLAQGQAATIYHIESHLALGGALFCLADFVPASEHLEKGASLYNPHEHSSFIPLFAADPGAFCSAWAAHPLWHIGYPDRALERSLEAIQRAEALAHPYSMALAFNYAAILHQFRRETESAFEKAEAAISICRENKFAYYIGWAMIIKGWSLAKQDDEKGVNEIKQGLKMLRDTGAKRSLPYYLCLLAETHGNGGRTQKGLQIISEGIVAAEEMEERWWEAELYRVKGDLMLQQSEANEEQAENHFRRALEVARKQQSQSLELRAANSLARLWKHQGKDGQARQLLFKIYDQLNEGFDTPDLREAQNLLQ